MNTSQELNSRYDSFDVLRGVAGGVLSILFHATMAYLPVKVGYVVQDESQSWFLFGLAGFLHLFRIPIFFIISGFFFVMVFQKLTFKQFLKNRMKRIFIPFITTMLLLMPFVGWMWNYTGALKNTGVGPAYLWYLYYLFFFYSGGIVWFKCFNGLKIRFSSVLVFSKWSPFIWSLPATFFFFFMKKWEMVDPPEFSFNTPIATLFFYFLFFLYGMHFFFAKEGIINWNPSFKLNIFMSVVFSLLIASCLFYKDKECFFSETTLRMTCQYASASLSWFMSLLFLGLVCKKFNKPNPKMKYLSDLSYWFYLVHYPIIAALSLLLSGIPMHWSLKYCFICVTTFAFLFWTYKKWVRYTIIGEYLHGKRA